MPPADELVTWPGLQDAINGVKGEFAAYRPSSRARSSAEVKHLTQGFNSTKEFEKL